MIGGIVGGLAGRAVMEGQHWVMLAVVFVVAFVFARTQMGTTLASKVGLS